MGGYYDGGDHVKFGLPMAFSVTMLSWGVTEFRKEITGQNQMGNTLAAIKWGTDYFIKAHPQPNVLWAQVSTVKTFPLTLKPIYGSRVEQGRPSLGHKLAFVS